MSFVFYRIATSYVAVVNVINVCNILCRCVFRFQFLDLVDFWRFYSVFIDKDEKCNVSVSWCIYYVYELEAWSRLSLLCGESVDLIFT